MGQLQITPEGYTEIKSRIKEKLNETTNNFIIIGYYLKQVRDNMLYLNDGYHNMEEFAQGEYRLSASTASRFMDINTRFSEGGNSLEIKGEYRNFGYSKLQEMLNVKEEDIQLITEEMTVKQIREIKAAEKAEEKAEAEEAGRNLPLLQMEREEAGEDGQYTDYDEKEKYPEEVATSQEEGIYSPIERTLIALWKSKPEELVSKVHNNMITPKELAEELCPSGGKTFTNGIYMMLLYGYDKGIKLRYYQDGKINIEEYSYNDVLVITHDIMTDELFAEIIGKKETEDKKEWKAPDLREKRTPGNADEVKKQNPSNERKEEQDTEEAYTPIQGQMTTEDIPELTTEVSGEDQPEKEQPEQDEHMAAEPAIDAEYREIEQTGQQEKEESEIPEYSDIEIRNAIGYFETEYYRMVGTGLKESAKCRNYKMALEAIRKCYGQ